MPKAAKTPELSPNTYVDGQALVPEIIDEDDMDALSNTFQQFAHLPPKRLAVLMQIGRDLVSETPRSDSEIARVLGINRETVYNCRNDPQWSVALGILVVGIARGRSDLYLQWTEQSARKGSVGSLKLLWELTGLYIQKHKNLNVNVDATPIYLKDQSFDNVIDEFIIALGGAGWSAQQIVSRYNELRSQGAW